MPLHGILPKRYMLTVLLVLESRGLTIPEIEAKNDKQYAKSPAQARYYHLPVWHTRMNLEERAAEILRLEKNEVLGGDRPTSDFQNHITRQIAKLRRRGYLADLDRPGRPAIYRLGKQVGTLAGKVEARLLGVERAMGQKNAVDPEQKMMNTFENIMRHGIKDTTYKFALARALLDSCRNRPDDCDIIRYRDLASLFLKYYWHQVYRFKIRQSFKLTDPNVMQIVETVFGDDKKKRFGKVAQYKKEKATNLILDSVFGSTKNKKGIVLSAFHTVGASSEPVFYEYYDKMRLVRLMPGAVRFFRRNYYVLLMTTIAEWAKFLERANRSLPRLVSKVEKGDYKRGSLGRYKKMYKQHMCECFYCGVDLASVKTEVDHFIPWSYMFDDDVWNLVLACKDCNMDKSDTLPNKQFKDKLLERNRRYHTVIAGLGRSIEILDVSGGWEAEIEKHYKLCQEHKFEVWEYGGDGI